MFNNYIYDFTEAKYYNKIFLFDKDNLNSKYNFIDIFKNNGYKIINYISDLDFRSKYNDIIYDSKEKNLIYLNNQIYVPYDLRKIFHFVELSIDKLFPRLNSKVIKENLHLNYDLLIQATSKNYDYYNTPEETTKFIKEKVYCKDNIHSYVDKNIALLKDFVSNADNYRDWLVIADIKADIDLMIIEYDLEHNTDFVNEPFKQFIMNKYGSLFFETTPNPIIINKVLDYIISRSEKFAIIVMDGMSEIDWKILSKRFDNIDYKKSSYFAMVPTTTSISRQCLLSGKFPNQLQSPWSTNKEKEEFVSSLINSNLAKNNIEYCRCRDYNTDIIRSDTKYVAFIINEIDDIMHGQKQGRKGMFNDITQMSKEVKLKNMAKELLKKGFDVYICTDHGNTQCKGIGKINNGVDIETKSHRMLVVKDYGKNYDNLINYSSKHYLNKDYQYFICKTGESLDNKGEVVINHGGITIEEVIVPFIQIKKRVS